MVATKRSCCATTCCAATPVYRLWRHSTLGAGRRPTVYDVLALGEEQDKRRGRRGCLGLRYHERKCTLNDRR